MHAAFYHSLPDLVPCSISLIDSEEMIKEIHRRGEIYFVNGIRAAGPTQTVPVIKAFLESMAKRSDGNTHSYTGVACKCIFESNYQDSVDEAVHFALTLTLGSLGPDNSWAHLARYFMRKGQYQTSDKCLRKFSVERGDDPWGSLYDYLMFPPTAKFTGEYLELAYECLCHFLSDGSKEHQYRNLIHCNYKQRRRDGKTLPEGYG